MIRVNSIENTKTALMASRLTNLERGRDKYQLKDWRVDNLFSFKNSIQLVLNLILN